MARPVMQGKADGVCAFQADDVTDGAHGEHEHGEEQRVHAHPERCVRIAEAAVFLQEEGEDDDEGEVRQAIEKLDEVGQPEVLAAFLEHAELREVACYGIPLLGIGIAHSIVL